MGFGRVFVVNQQFFEQTDLGMNAVHQAAPDGYGAIGMAHPVGFCEFPEAFGCVHGIGFFLLKTVHFFG
jgi:hypothetical protein